MLASSPQSRGSSSSSSSSKPVHTRTRSASTSNAAAAAATTDEAAAAAADNTDSNGASPTADVSNDVVVEQDSAQPLCMPPTRQREYVLRCYSSSYVHGDAAAHGSSAFEHDDHDGIDSSRGPTSSSNSAVEHCSAPPSRLYACTDGASLRLALALCESEL